MVAARGVLSTCVRPHQTRPTCNESGRSSDSCSLALSAYLGGGPRALLAQSAELPRAYAALIRAVAKAVRWEPLEAPDRLKPKEVRVWFGFGEELPNTVLRLQHGSDSMVGELVFWWRKGRYARSIRESLSGERGCAYKGKGERVEVCRLTVARDWRASGTVSRPAGFPLLRWKLTRRVILGFLGALIWLLSTGRVIPTGPVSIASACRSRMRTVLPAHFARCSCPMVRCPRRYRARMPPTSGPHRCWAMAHGQHPSGRLWRGQTGRGDEDGPERQRL